MYADLLDEAIQPRNIDAYRLPEIRISDSLAKKIQEMLEDEEGGFVHAFTKTAIVQTDKNYVFIPYQWLYLTVLCKKYAEALRPYGDFYDRSIRNDAQRLSIFTFGNIESPLYKQILPDATDRERMMKYVMGDPEFRPGKALINSGKSRSTKDIFGSCILKKIAVPDASSAYLGNLIYYFAKRPALYDELDAEIRQQLGDTKDSHALPEGIKDCAKAIVDCIYGLDHFGRIAGLFDVQDQSVKIRTSDITDILPSGNWLRYMFARPESSMYDPESAEGKPRVFKDEYEIHVGQESYKCRLTTEWVGNVVTADSQGNNYLQALVKVVNKFYSDLVEIKTISGKYYLYYVPQKFDLSKLPDVFDSAFARRYITSLLAKPFVILTGNSGTGKTRIARQFAQYLAADEDNWLIVPVGADWTDNTRVLGYHNSLADKGAGKYEKTKIVELIERANAHPEIPYFLILDEMNLSHVERYFSDFLSHMEIPDDPFELDGYEDNNGRLPYPANLFVTGTVNIDETTYMFSPKVLDRANVVEFKPEKDTVLASFDENTAQAPVARAPYGMAEAFYRLAKDIRDGKCGIDETQMSEIKTVFAQIYDITESRGYEFAYRTVKEIKQYISAAYELADGLDDAALYQAIDEQLLQKILPKIHGNRKELSDMLEKLSEVCKTEGKELKLSEMKIEQMKDKLSSVQYASFI